MALTDKRVLIFAEDNYEDLELWYPKLRLEEDEDLAAEWRGLYRAWRAERLHRPHAGSLQRRRGVTARQRGVHRRGPDVHDDAAGTAVRLALHRRPLRELLGRIVAQVSGQPFAAYLKEHILEPLGMASTTMEAAQVPPQLPAPHTQQHSEHADRLADQDRDRRRQGRLC